MDPCNQLCYSSSCPASRSTISRTPLSLSPPSQPAWQLGSYRRRLHDHLAKELGSLKMIQQSHRCEELASRPPVRWRVIDGVAVGVVIFPVCYEKWDSLNPIIHRLRLCGSDTGIASIWVIQGPMIWIFLILLPEICLKRTGG